MTSCRAVLLVLLVTAAAPAQRMPAHAAQGARAVRAPTLADVSYGPHERNVLDFWKAEGDGPRPLLVVIHGGGWVTGDKSEYVPKYLSFVDEGISVASIQYRLTTEAPLPAPVHDAARAIQFLRWKAGAWEIDTERIVLTGTSAGACTSMWLLLHDDLADPEADDPVLRQSTRVRAAGVEAGQTSIDPLVAEALVGPMVLHHPMLTSAVGERTAEGVRANYERHRAVYEEFSPSTHLDARDPPLFLKYPPDLTVPSRDPGHAIHHPLFGVALKEKADALGHETHLLIWGHSRSERYPRLEDFLLAMLRQR